MAVRWASRAKAGSIRRPHANASSTGSVADDPAAEGADTPAGEVGVGGCEEEEGAEAEEAAEAVS